jgi:hypothetical protein
MRPNVFSRRGALDGVQDVGCVGPAQKPS